MTVTKINNRITAPNFQIDVIDGDSQHKLTLSCGNAVRTHSYADSTALGTALAAIETAIKAGYVDFDTLLEPDFSVEPTAAVFDKENPEDVIFNLENAQSETLTVKNGETTLTASTDYTFDAETNKLTILDDYLSTLDNGESTLQIIEEGVSILIVITVSGLGISPDEAAFDKTEQTDLEFTVTGGVVTGIVNGEEALTENTDYEFDEETSVLTIKKEYLATLDNGTAAFEISGSHDSATVTIEVSGETPAE